MEDDSCTGERAAPTGVRYHVRPEPRGDRTLGRRDRGQATTEYALVLLAAALVGLLVVGWATSGGGAAAVGKLFERVIDSVIDKV
jgi:hypothetical protein